MRLPRVRFTMRGMMIAVADFAIFTYYAAVPTWDYDSLPPKTRQILTKLGQPMPSPRGGPLPLRASPHPLRPTSGGAPQG